MGMGTNIVAVILFIGLIAIPIYLVSQFHSQIDSFSSSILTIGDKISRVRQSGISVYSISYDDSPNINLSIIIKNIGSHILSLDNTFLFINGTKIENVTKKFLIDLANPNLWDSGDRIIIETPYYIDEGSLYEIIITSDYASKTKVIYNSSSSIQIYKNQPNPVDPIENISYMESAITLYNPNNYDVIIYNVSDNWDLKGVINTSDYSCSPSSCTVDILNNRVYWNLGYSLSSENYQIFKYRININGTLDGLANSTSYFYTNKGHGSRKLNNISFVPKSANAFLEIQAESSSFQNAIGTYNGTINTSFNFKLSETANTTEIKSGQQLAIKIPSDALDYGYLSGSENGTHILLPTTKDIINDSEILNMWMVLPDYHLPLLLNSTLIGLDGANEEHNDLFEILVITSGIPPEVGVAKINDSQIGKNQITRLYQTVNDTSGVGLVKFRINEKEYTPSFNGTHYIYDFKCTTSGSYIWNLTRAQDIREYEINKSFSNVNFVCDIPPELVFYREQTQGCSENKKLPVRFFIYALDSVGNLANDLNITEVIPSAWDVELPSIASRNGNKLIFQLSDINPGEILTTNYNLTCNFGNHNLNSTFNYSYALGNGEINRSDFIEVNNSKLFFDSELRFDNTSSIIRKLTTSQIANITITPTGNLGAVDEKLNYIWNYNDSLISVSNIPSFCSDISYNGLRALNCSLNIPTDGSSSFTFSIDKVSSGNDLTYSNNSFGK